VAANAPFDSFELSKAHHTTSIEDFRRFGRYRLIEPVDAIQTVVAADDKHV
jgi:hypothetical protein